MERLARHEEKLGIAGFGGRGRLIAQKLLDLGFNVLGVHDSNPSQLANAPFRTFTELSDLLKLELDALIVTTPPSSHAAIAELALERGLDLFVEKPMGSSFDQSRRIVQAQERAGRLVAVGYIERVNPAIMKLREIADLPTVVRSREIRVGLFPPARNGTGVLLDLASHGIDIAYHLFHAEPKVRSTNLTTRELGKPDFECAIELDYGDTRSYIEARYAKIRRRRLELETEDEYYEVTYTPAAIKIGFPPPKLSKRPGSFADLEQLSRNVEMNFDVPRLEPMNIMLLLFASSVGRGSLIEPLCSAREALVTAKAIEDAKKIASFRVLKGTSTLEPA